jgi:hypothetical protein
MPKLASVRAAAWEATRTKRQFVLDYALDQKSRDTITFKGYAAKYKPSEVSGLPRLWYDRAEPYEKQIPYYNYLQTVRYGRQTLRLHHPASLGKRAGAIENK